ncbi:MAG: hypothetical protein P1U85_20150 [Verrucomicrobiales bacterium]|nr:hypothetical protein [Verrucomicrobiales bacterium]
MNRLTLPILAVFALVAAPAIHAEDERILEIRAKYNQTENAKLSQRTIKLDDGPETAELVKSYDANGILVKMAFTSGSDHGFGTEYYYVDRGNLYFVFQTQGSWRFDPNGPEGTTIDTSMERRVYYAKEQVIRHLLKEASSRNPEAVAGLLKKAENKNVSNAEAEAILLSNAKRLLLVDTQKELENFLYQE